MFLKQTLMKIQEGFPVCVSRVLHAIVVYVASASNGLAACAYASPTLTVELYASSRRVK